MLYSFSSKPIKTELRCSYNCSNATSICREGNLSTHLKQISIPFVNPSHHEPTANDRNSNGHITTVLAVLLIHMLIKAVAIINPSTTLLGVVPVILIIVRAMRLCRCTFSNAKAKTKPPKNRKIIGLP